MSTLRETVAADCEAIGEIHVAVWRETYAGMLPGRMLADLSAHRRAAMWRRSLESGDLDNLLVVEDGAA